MAKLTPQTALDHARRDLDRALRAGDDTTEARERVANAEAALAQAEQDSRKTAAEILAERVQRIETETAAMVDEALAEILAEIDAVLPGHGIAVRIAPDVARKLVEAREGAQEAEERRMVIHDELATLETRIRDLETERAGIVARRRAGQRDDVVDAGRIGLIDIDLADLRALADQQRGALSALPINDIGAFTRQWAATIKAGRAAARLALAAELERRLLMVAGTLKADAPPGNTANRWRPSLELRGGIQTGVF